MDDKRIKLCLIVFFLIFSVGKANAQAVPATISNIFEESFSVGYVSWTGSNVIDASVGKWEFGQSFPGQNSTLHIEVDVNDGGIAFFDYFAERNDGTSFSIAMIPPPPQALQPVISGFQPPTLSFIPNPIRRFSLDLNPYRQQTIIVQFNTNYPLFSSSTFQGRALITDFQLATCPVAPLTPLTDPDAIAFENGNQINTDPQNFNLNTELSCLSQEVSSRGGNGTLTSAYRPPQYQAHLREVFFATQALRNLRTPECATLKAEVMAEATQHQIIRRPARSSRHSFGDAFDFAVTGLTPIQIDASASACGLRRPLPVRDRVHFTR